MCTGLCQKHTRSTNAFNLLLSLTAEKLRFYNDWLLWQMTLSKDLVVALMHTI